MDNPSVIIIKFMSSSLNPLNQVCYLNNEAYEEAKKMVKKVLIP